jgi:hypothetical protein
MRVSFIRILPDLLLLLCGLVILVSAVVAIMAAWHWPLVGDSALMHYVVLLLHSGRKPYSEIVDINFPGSYLLEALSMRVFGPGQIGLRLYDGALCLLVCLGAVVLSGNDWRSRLCGLIAGLLFVLIHLRDGVIQAGQRDLAMVVIVLLAYVALLRWPVPVNLQCIFLFEVLIGFTLVIKPTLFPLFLLPIFFIRSGYKTNRKSLWIGMIGLFLPVLLTCFWLHEQGSIRAAGRMLRLISESHALLAHKSVMFLVTHSVSPLAGLLLLCVVLCFTLRSPFDRETTLLLYGALCGLLSFIGQGKGFPYQRYPALLLILLCVFRFVARGFRETVYARAVALTIVVISCLWFAPRFAEGVRSYDQRAPFVEALTKALVERGAGPQEVQCLDTVGGCINALYNLHLTQSTGFLYDCYAYAGPEQSQQVYRRSLLEALTAAKPRYIVLSSQSCLEEKGAPERVSRWPSLQQFLGNRYSLDGYWAPSGPIKWWNQKELPPSFVIYRLKMSDSTTS